MMLGHPDFLTWRWTLWITATGAAVEDGFSPNEWTSEDFVHRLHAGTQASPIGAIEVVPALLSWPVLARVADLQGYTLDAATIAMRQAEQKRFEQLRIASEQNMARRARARGTKR